MSGLLRRLANRARSGATPAVHSMARMPYIAPLELKEAEAASSVETTESRAPAERTTEPRERSTTVEREPSPVAAGRTLPDNASEVRGPTPDLEDVEIPISLREERIPVQIAEPVVRDAAPAPHPRDAVHAAEPAEVRVFRAEGAPLRETVVSRLPSTPRFVLPPSASTGTRIGTRPPVEDREPTEVHVHIGRIEVTAVHEPAPEKRERRPDREPMTLDEYLDRRRRRSS